MNGLLLVGLALNSALSAIVATSGELPILGWILLACAALSWLGAVLIATPHARLGAMLVIGGSIAFVPLGMIAILGARKVLDRLAQEAFDRRRVAGSV